MTPTFRLGRVAGIEVGANWSWLLVVALIVWSLAAGVFPDSNPGLSDGTYLAMALVAALLFFLSLFLHELGHALRRALPAPSARPRPPPRHGQDPQGPNPAYQLAAPTAR